MNAASPERLNRFLARRGLASRRGADLLIAAGRVFVNGRAAAIGAQVDPDLDMVLLDGRPVVPATSVTTVMLNKPRGVVTTVSDPGRRPTVMHLVEPTPGLVPVGRLDADSRGLLLLSSDGELVHRLTHPRHGVVKRYRVTAAHGVAAAELERLTAGVTLGDGIARALAAKRARGRAGTVIDVDIAQGRKREVRRLCAALGIDVVDLQRIAFGPLRLGALAEGAWRSLTTSESTALYTAAQLPAP